MAAIIIRSREPVIMIHQLVYHSKSTTRAGGREILSQLRDILSKAQRNNGKCGVTGFLLFDKPWFVQVLEGSRADVTEIYRKIAADNRHSGLVVMNVRDIPQRCFPNWSMGGVLRTPELQAIFLKHGIGGPIDPPRMKSTQFIDLALDLLAFTENKQRHELTAAVAT